LLRRTNHTDNNSPNLLKGNTSVVILAGGKSERMNFPKPFLSYDAKRTFIEKIVDEYNRFGCREIIIVLNEDLNCSQWHEFLSILSKDTIIVYNKNSNLGRFYSLQLGIKALENNDYCFIQNIDSPFIDSDLLKKLYDSKTNYGYVVPEYKDKGGHPILIGREVINSIKEEKNISFNLKEKLRQFNKKTIDSGSDKVLVNINTLEEYKILFNNELLQKVLLREC
jgi:CTP:molybdopterin cytidylyltransferase MocA